MAIQQCVDDHLLIKLYLGGDEGSLGTLIERHRKRIYGYIYNLVKKRELAEDIFQDTFFKVINTLKKGQYNEEGKFLPWVLRISHNLVVDYFRKDNKMTIVTTVKNSKDAEGEETDILSRLKIKDTNAEEKIMKKQVYSDLKNLISMLPPEQKEVVMMRHYYDMSFKEISQTTNVSINTALGRMRYALINLRKMAEENKIVLNME